MSPMMFMCLWTKPTLQRLFKILLSVTVEATHIRKKCLGAHTSSHWLGAGQNHSEYKPKMFCSKRHSGGSKCFWEHYLLCGLYFRTLKASHITISSHRKHLRSSVTYRLFWSEGQGHMLHSLVLIRSYSLHLIFSLSWGQSAWLRGHMRGLVFPLLSWLCSPETQHHQFTVSVSLCVWVEHVVEVLSFIHSIIYCNLHLLSNSQIWFLLGWVRFFGLSFS